MLRHIFSEIFRKGRRPMLKPGDPAPDFELQDHHGKLVRLSGLRGQRVVLYFYPKADTPGCTKQGCGFRDRMRDYTAKGVAVLGISFDSVEDNRAFAEKFGYTFPLLSDVDRKAGLAYKAAEDRIDKYAKRFTYVIGPDGKIEQAIDTKDPAGQAAALLPTV